MKTCTKPPLQKYENLYKLLIMNLVLIAIFIVLY